MDKREKELSELKAYTEEIDKDLTMILQTLQWDRQHLLQGKPLVKCKYDTGHRIPEEIKEKHEMECFLKKHGYMDEDILLPEPLHSEANTVVKLSSTDIANIINIAASSDPCFKRGVGCEGPQPLTVERLQATYSVDERRAIHDAVVSQAPASHEVLDLTLPSGEDQEADQGKKTRLEILSEMRDMKRRPVKYRVASKTRNYSDVLRDVIKTQMEVYTEVKTELSSNREPKSFNPVKIKVEYSPSRIDEEDTSNNNHTDRTTHGRGMKRDPKYESSHNVRDTRRDDERSWTHRESEARHDRHRERREHTSNDYSDRSRYKEKHRSSSRESRSHRTEYIHHDKERRRRERSRDRTEKHGDRREKHKSNNSQSYGDIKVKEEKRRKHYDDYEDRRKH